MRFEDSQNQEGEGDRQHRAADSDVSGSVLLHAVATEDGVCHERVAAVHGA